MASGISRLRQLGGSGGPAARALERIGITVTGAGVAAIGVVGWICARAIGSRTMYLMVYAAATIVMMAWLVGRRRLSVEVARSQLPARVRAGQQVVVELTISPRRRATMIVLSEELHPRLGANVSIPVASLKPGEVITHAYGFQPSVRGVYEIGPMTATWSDPFGFTIHRQVLAEPVELIVHPETEPARDRVLTRMWEDPPVRPPISKPWPVGFEFYGMRDYVPGDDLRRVVWTAFARTGRMLVRESEQGITDRVVVLLDPCEEWHSPGDVSDTFETGVRAAASIGVQHLDDGFSVTLMTNDGVLAKGLRGGAAKLTLLDALARVERTTTPLGAAGFELLQQARNRPHFLVITPHVSDSEAQQLKLLVDRGLSVIVATLVWDESDPRSLAHCAAMGAQIVQIHPGASLSSVFAHQVGARVR